MNGPSVSILGVLVNAVDEDGVISCVDACLASGAGELIAYSHFGILLDARDNPAIRAVLASAALNHPDGVGAAWALRLLARRPFARLNGTDLYARLVGHLAARDARMFFLGGGPGTIESLRVRIGNLAGAKGAAEAGRVFFHHGYFADDDRSPVDSIAAARPDVLFVGLGSPRQFEWVRDHRAELRVPLIVLVGGGLEFLSGQRPRAPLWMRLLGLEWLHRLAREPRQLWKRYLAGIPRFVGLVATESFRRRRDATRAGKAAGRPGNFRTRKRSGP